MSEETYKVSTAHYGYWSSSDTQRYDGQIGFYLFEGNMIEKSSRLREVYHKDAWKEQAAQMEELEKDPEYLEHMRQLQEEEQQRFEGLSIDVIRDRVCAGLESISVENLPTERREYLCYHIRMLHPRELIALLTVFSSIHDAMEA